MFDLIAWSDLTDAYEGGGEEYVVVRSKLRPCVVLSDNADIRDRSCPRIAVVPIFHYNSPLLEAEVRRGSRPYFCHIDAAPNFDLEKGYADFTQTVGMPRFFFGQPKMEMSCRMDDDSLEVFMASHARWMHPPETA